MKTRAPIWSLTALFAIAPVSACTSPGRTMPIAQWSADHADPTAYSCESLPVRGSIVSSPDGLMAPEISQYPDLRPASALEVVRRLRPAYLSGSMYFGSTVSGEPRVIIDRTCENGVSILQRIPAARVSAVYYISPNDAVARYGPHYAGGIILISTISTDRQGSN